MSDDWLLVAIEANLRAAKSTKTAAEISREIGAPKGDVNSLLYRHVGERFIRKDESPPTWSLVGRDTTPSAPRRDRVALPIRSALPIHVDFQGGDWSLDVRLVAGSRNDPPVVVERLGPNRRLICVSDAYVSSDLDPSAPLPPEALVLAAGALVWEIALQRGAIDEENFDWHTAVRDVLLSLVAHSRIHG